MITSIVALILLQVRWLGESYAMSKEQFDRTIRLAAQEAFDNERKEVIAADLEKRDIQKDHHKITCEEGTIETSREISWNGDSSVQTINIVCEEGDSAYHESLEFLLSSDTRLIKTKSIQDSQEISQLFADVYKKYWSAPINVLIVEDHLAKALASQNLSLPYTLSFLNESDLSDKPILSEGERLFRLGAGAAVLRFDGEKSYLIKKMSSHFLSSILLSFLVIACFGYMLSTILRQKKISEIKNDFISNMTHELKTPISVIAAANEAMRHFHVLDDPVRTDKYLNISKNELDRLALMVDKVLQAARFEKEKIKLRPEPVNVESLLETVIDNHRLNSSKEIVFQLKSELNSDHLSLDRMHFSNVLNNIIDNAVKYSGEKVEIDAEIKEGPENVSIRIKDNGRGMNSETLKHLFEKFYREPTGDIHNVKGFGLGLHYVKNIMDLIGGQVSVSSQHGKGSEFILSIPKIS